MLLSKQRILEIYLNQRRMGRTACSAPRRRPSTTTAKARPQLSAYEAARLAVMLPAAQVRFEKVPNSGYLSSRASTIVARMGDAVLP
jgi:monofunctional biosynthetic peptidoglycan transglycosylase